MSIRDDLEDLIDQHRKAGWRVTKTRSGHWRWQPPDGGALTFTGSTPSDHRALQNIKGQLRRSCEQHAAPRKSRYKIINQS